MIVRWRSITDSGKQSTAAKNNHKTAPTPGITPWCGGLFLFLLEQKVGPPKQLFSTPLQSHIVAICRQQKHYRFHACSVFSP